MLIALLSAIKALRRLISISERRLARITGKAKESTGADVINSLSKIREDVMSSLLGSSVECNSEYSSGSDAAQNNAFALLERKLFPEKQALSAEELERLLERDVLAKLVAQANDDQHDQQDRAN